MKRSIAILMSVVWVLVMIPATLAQESFSGTGTITAWGNGSAAMHGDGTVTITGNGVLYVIDRYGDAEIEVSGDGYRTERKYHGYTLLIYRGFNGEATISGTHFGAMLRGKDIHLTAEGTGKIVLKGRGEYEINGRTYSWTADGVTVQFGSANGS